MSSPNWQYETPVFDAGDPLVCRSLQLRPSLWGVLFNELQRLGYASTWRQDDPSHASPEEVAKEFVQATDEAVFAGCIMIGQIVEMAIDTAPAWLLLCDGSEYANDDYPLLAAVIHPNLQTDPDHFRVPDRFGRVGLGGTPIGYQDGEAEHTLTAAEMPSHTHTAHDHTPDVDVEGPAGVPQGAPGLWFPAPTGSAGGGDPHNNMPPYEGSQFYIIAAYPTAG